MAEIALYFSVAFMITHAVDAIAKYEWRLFPILNSHPDDLRRVILIRLKCAFGLILVWIASARFHGLRNSKAVCTRPRFPALAVTRQSRQ
ncbi:MAG: hypothetical protein ACR2PF_14100 [Rhizobiaceae bacterium]